MWDGVEVRALSWAVKSSTPNWENIYLCFGFVQRSIAMLDQEWAFPKL